LPHERARPCASGDLAAPRPTIQDVDDVWQDTDIASKFQVVADNTTGLRIVRKGRHFTFLFDAGGDAKRWIEFYADDFDAPVNIRAGVLAINTTANEFPARLSALQVNGKK
jgi:hypothetical protein